MALAVVGSDELLSFLASLPGAKRQPNLFFAAVRWTCSLPKDEEALLQAVKEKGDVLREVMLSRSTQTNEPARCAVLLPLLAALPQPLALLEVGASAGLCLLPDRYAYSFGGRELKPVAPESGAPEFPCACDGSVPLPAVLPQVVWRRGLDLNPLDVTADEDVAWLEALVWPEHVERRERLKAAIVVARRGPPAVERGDLLADLPEVAKMAPAHATLVVFHTAVLAYVPEQANRDRFAETVREIGAVWISNEAPEVFPSIADGVDRATAPSRDSFLLALNGVPVAWTNPHGSGVRWIAKAALEGLARPKSLR